MNIHNNLATEIHADNIKAGWWTDINTGESIVGTRNIGELLGLVYSELSEAREADIFNLMDDKLPHRYGVEVEFADAAIRIYDIAGAYKFYLHHQITMTKDEATIFERGAIHCFVGRAFEGFRKNKLDGAQRNLNLALLSIYQECGRHGYDLTGAIAEKRAFNHHRADHKLENRKLANGKKF